MKQSERDLEKSEFVYFRVVEFAPFLFRDLNNKNYFEETYFEVAVHIRNWCAGWKFMEGDLRVHLLGDNDSCFDSSRVYVLNEKYRNIGKKK